MGSPTPAFEAEPVGRRTEASARPERRLAAILAADVAGYSRLMGRDEAGTLARLKALRTEVVEPLLAEHRGRLVKLMGDGALCEFASAVDAVECAVRIQDAVADRERARDEGERVRLRIGINLGDVIREADGDLYGDGVNIAARLEQLAGPGGVCVAANVREQVKGKLALRFAPMGRRRLKNIAEPPEVWRVVPGETVRRPARRWPVAAAAGALLLAVAAGAWWSLGRAPPYGAAAPVAAVQPEAPRLSIVVLPFANLGDDPEQEYFADGITDDLTTDLSRIDGSLVIAPQTALTYKGRVNLDPREVGRELGVRYVLQGNVRRSGNQVVINAQLVDAGSGANLWAERFEGARDDLPVLQDRVTGGVASTLRLELVRAEARRAEQERRTDPDALDDAMRGWAAFFRPFSQENREEARRLFERALATDPDTVDALVGLAQVLTANTLEGWTATPDQDRERADELLRRALDLEPNRAATYFGLGLLRRAQGRLEEAADALRTALALDPNYARAYLQLGQTLMYMGRPGEAIPLVERSLRLNPRDPNLAVHFYVLGYSHLLLGQADESIGYFEKARASNPRLYYVHLYLAAALGLAGRVDEARRELAESLRLKPDYDTLARLAEGQPGRRYPAHVALCERTVYVGLRRAGMPDG